MKKILLIVAALAVVTVLFAISVPTAHASGPSTGGWGTPYYNPYQGGYYGRGYSNTGYYGNKYYQQNYYYKSSYNRYTYYRPNVKYCCCYCYSYQPAYNRGCSPTYYKQYPQQGYNNYQRVYYHNW